MVSCSKLTRPKLSLAMCFNLQAGNAVPVDARLIKATSVQVDQSALTGESVPESKSCF